MEELSPGTTAALCGLAGGAVLGFAARWGRFCALGAIEDKVLAGNGLRLRMWGLAIAIGALATYGLHGIGLIDISRTFYLASPTTLIATLVGSLIFGFGMSLVGTCGFGTLARIGGGDLKSIVTFLVMGITAYATLGGAAAYLRIGLGVPARNLDPGNAGFAFAIEQFMGVPASIAGIILALLLAGFCLSSKALRQNVRVLFTAALVGLTIAFGWFATGVLAYDPFESYPLESFTFSAPLGEALIYVMTMTGASLKFGIGAVAGVIVGAAITTLVQRHFRWEVCDDAREMRRQMLGGVLMGFGGVTALGCTVGQGLSAASALAYSAPIALIGIYLGAWIGLHALVHGSVLEPLKQVWPLGSRQ